MLVLNALMLPGAFLAEQVVGQGEAQAEFICQRIEETVEDGEGGFEVVSKVVCESLNPEITNPRDFRD